MRLSFKAKILLLTILPMVALSLAISWMYQRQARELTEQHVAIFEENLLESRRQALIDYVSLAMNSINPVLEDMRNGLEPALGEERIKHILRGLTYDKDGYFFCYTADGVNLVHSTQPDLEGKNLMDLQDENGQYVIRDLLAIARKGGGFYQYLWRKPTNGLDQVKLSYVITIPRMGWMMGTGIYVDDIIRQVQEMRSKVAANARRSFWASTIMLVVTLSMVVLVVTLVNMHTAQLADQRLQELANRFVTFQVMQRRNFARELHDGINQLLVSTKLRLNLADKKWPDDSALEHLGKAIEQLNTAIQEVRRISHNLRPILLDDLGLEAALHGLLDELEENADISTRRHIRIPRQRLPDAIEMTIYRVVQEAITNIRKHADANFVSISLRSDQQTIQLTLGDNGKGFSPDTDKSGIGIMNMRERVELLGGKFSVRNRRRGGTLIHAVFQLDPEPDLTREQSIR
ncbi:cache domain-containing protein [Parathalassolituus penaei]|uniref:Cache domain-containing protein n=1 Tax=Parathalassolituus penaei TaxID=2997323 RepID=A0A9X3EHA3_9GAMM|nr:cache domain-containing protein [Parathalassolituus penaei]MCY0966700.1 cache domain-containing protein [Parathalassolituus penaei]